MQFYGQTITGESRGYAWNPRAGYSQVVLYTGTPSELEAIALIAKNNNYTHRYLPDAQGSYSTLEVTYGAAETQDPAEPLSDEWSLVGNDLEKSIFEHPSVTSQQEGWSVQEKLDFKAISEASARGNADSVTEIRERLIESKKTAASDLLDKVATELAKGVEAFPVSQYVLRRNQVITNNSSIKPTLDNVGKVYTTSAVKNSYGIPDTIKFSLPEGFWLKRTPTVEPTGQDKYIITQEFWHADEYSVFLYGDPIE